MTVDEPTRERPSSIRYFILVLLAHAAASAYLVRILGSAATTIQADFNLEDQELGQVLGAFALGYFWFMIPGGVLANRFGVRTVFPVIAVWWSASALWASLARTPQELHAARFVLGLAQAGLVPCAAKAIGDWFPARERGVASSIFTMSMQLGGIVAIGLTSQLLHWLSWRSILAVYASSGVVWAILFAWLFRNTPAEAGAVNAGEVALIAEGRVPQLMEPSVGWAARLRLLAAMATSLSLALVCVQSFFRAFGYEFFTSWFPAYLEQARHVDLRNAGLLATLPMIAAAVGSLSGGAVVDLVYRRTGSKWTSRCGVAAFALTLTAGCCVLASWVTDANLAVFVLSVGMFWSALAGPASWAMTLDISGRQSAVVFAVMNMVGNIGAYACPVSVGYLIGYIKQTDGDWNWVLYLFAGVYLCGALSVLALNPNRRCDERGSE